MVDSPPHPQVRAPQAVPQMTVDLLNSCLEFGFTQIPSISYIYFLYYIQSHHPSIKTPSPLWSLISHFFVSLASDIPRTSLRELLWEFPTHTCLSSNGLHSTGFFFLLHLFSREHYTNLNFGASLCLSIGCHLIIWKVKNSANTLPFSRPPCYWFNCQNANPRLPATRTHGLHVSIFVLIFPLSPSTPKNHPIPLLEVLNTHGQNNNRIFYPRVFITAICWEVNREAHTKIISVNYF